MKKIRKMIFKVIIFFNIIKLILAIWLYEFMEQ